MKSLVLVLGFLMALIGILNVYRRSSFIVNMIVIASIFVSGRSIVDGRSPRNVEILVAVLGFFVSGYLEIRDLVRGGDEK
jgi:hypothetical protein